VVLAGLFVDDESSPLLWLGKQIMQWNSGSAWALLGDTTQQLALHQHHQKWQKTQQEAASARKDTRTSSPTYHPMDASLKGPVVAFVRVVTRFKIVL